MADPRDKSTTSNPVDDDQRVSAIEERIERLRRMHGWAAESKPAAASKVESVVDTLDGERNRAKQSKSALLLRFALPGKPEETVEVTEEHYDIGSGERAKLRILDPSVSARHCRISRDGDGFRVRDMNTHTGTWVNGERIPLSSALAHGDVLRCGDISLTVLLRDENGVVAPLAVPPPPPPAIPTAKPASTASSKASSLPVKPPVSAATPKQSNPAGSQPAFPAEPSKTAMRPAFPRPKTMDGLPAIPATEPTSATKAMPSDAPKGHATKTGLSMKEALAAKAAALAAKAASAAAAAKPPEFPPLPMASASAGCVLVFFDADGNEAEVEIPLGGSLTVGRRSSCDLRLTDSGISSHHACFEWRGSQLYVRDLGSTNGTWVHGERIEESKLIDQDVVRLGLFPLRVRYLGEGEAIEVEPPALVPVAKQVVPPPPPPEPEPEPELAPAPPWFVLYINDAAQVAAVRLDAYEPSLIIGSGPVDLCLSNQNLKSEHIQLDWMDGQLVVMAARRDAAVKVNGRPINEMTLNPGDLISAGNFQGRVVCGSTLAPLDGSDPELALWSKRLAARAQELELLFVDPTVPGGRVELSLWGDGAAQAEQHSVSAREPKIMPLDETFMAVLIEGLTTAGFPIQPEQSAVNGVELHGFWGEDRVSVQLGEGLSEDWAFVSELLRSLMDLLLV